MLVAGAQRHRLQNHDQQRQPHGELRKQVVKGDGKGKVDPVQGECVQGVWLLRDRPTQNESLRIALHQGP